MLHYLIPPIRVSTLRPTWWGKRG